MEKVLDGRLMNDHLSQSYVGRLAPSPTGALHLGNIRTFMIAYLRARSCGGKLIYRLEDLDHPKDKPGSAEQLRDDLLWLGFDWDEEYVQSSRREFYREALKKLREKNLVYPCICSRRDVEAAQSAPHEGEQLYYPGICRDRFLSWEEAFNVSGRMPCWRFRVEENTVVEFEDVFAGCYKQNISKTLGDFPLARDIDGAGYTLAVVADDLDMGVTEIVRGDDLLPATPAHILIAKSLGEKVIPSYCHIPLVVGSDGRRLAKRHGDSRISTFRALGYSAEEIIGKLAFSCGWCKKGEAMSLKDLLPIFTLSTIPHKPFIYSSEDDTQR